VGTVSKQASWSTLLNYFGVAIGFLNVAYFMNNWFSPEQLGLRNFILDVAIVISQFAHLGTFRSLIKFFPFFHRNANGKYDNGLLSIGLIVPLVGFTFFALLLLVFKSEVIDKFNGPTTLFEQFYWALFPMSFLLLYNSLLESYLQARSSTIFSAFLKNVFNRIVVTILLILFYFEIIDFFWFMVYFMLSYVLNIVLFISHLFSRGEFSLKLNRAFFASRVRRIYFSYSSFSILAGISSALINKVDAIMIGFYLGLASTAVYTNAFYISSLIYMPADAISKISLSMLSSYWKEKKMGKIDELYKKSALSQLLIGGTLFILLWSSVDSFYLIQKDIYASGKMVLLLLGLSKVINMSFGLNSQILNISKYYRFDTTTSILLALITVFTNWLFIPYFGINGAAFATLISIIGFNLIRYFYVWNKLKIQPFTLQTLKAFFILCIGFVVGQVLPKLDNAFFDMIYRSIIITMVIGVPTIYFKISDDLNSFYRKGLNRIKYQTKN
jgi:O-antigen/teichoic acid export membrane protein